MKPKVTLHTNCQAVKVFVNYNSYNWLKEEGKNSNIPRKKPGPPKSGLSPLTQSK